MKSIKILFLIAACFVAAPLAAQMPVPAPPTVGAQGYILVDHRTGHVIAERAADEPLEPASLTKLMTAYVVFKALQEGSVAVEDEVPISVTAWRTEGSRMFIQEGTRVPLLDLLRGMIIVSGNDASVALAEHVAGTESAFAELMNFYAEQLGMHGSRFFNSTGLPAAGHITTARDMAVLTSAIIREFPEYYSLYSELRYTWGDITQDNRNNLLRRDASVDGGKTGFTTGAGYCLVASALRDDMRLVSVVLGTNSTRAREDATQALLNYGFRFYETYRLFGPGDTVATTRVWKGMEEEVRLGVPRELWVTVQRGQRDQLEAEVDLQQGLTAPLPIGEALGSLRVVLNGEELARSALLSQHEIAPGSWMRRARDTVLLWLE